MGDRYKLSKSARQWHIMARKGAGAATEAAWVSLGGCPAKSSQCASIWRSRRVVGADGEQALQGQQKGGWASCPAS